MAIQTSFTERPAVAVEGDFVNSGGPRNVETKRVETAAIPFGRFVKKGTADDQIALPEAGDVGADLTHATVFEHAHNKDVMLDANGAVTPGNLIAAMDLGELWFVAQSAVTAGGNVFVALGTGADPAGTVRADADSGNAVDLGNGARFNGSAAADELVKVKIDLYTR